jgi:hypothetical protein
MKRIRIEVALALIATIATLVSCSAPQKEKLEIDTTSTVLSADSDVYVAPFAVTDTVAADTVK